MDMSNSRLVPAPLPAEIWDECWSHSGPDELHSLCLVCPVFHVLCRPRLFCNLEYSGAYTEQITRRKSIEVFWKTQRSRVRFEELAKSPLRSHVRSWEYWGEEMDVDQWPFEDLGDIRHIDVEAWKNKETFMRHIPFYDNLRELNLRNMVIDFSAVQILCACPQLNILRFAWCLFCVTNQVPLMDVLELYIEDRDDLGHTGHLALFAPRTLARLHIASSRADVFLRPFNEFDLFPCLTHLHVDPEAGRLRNLETLLRKCPVLSAVEIPNWHVNQDFSHLAPSIIPLLKYFTGSPKLVSGFVEGRPITTTVVRNGRLDGDLFRVHSLSDIERIINHIVQSTAALQRLELPLTHPRLDIFQLVVHAFPELRWLSIAIDDGSCYRDTDSDEGSNSDSDSYSIVPFADGHDDDVGTVFNTKSSGANDGLGDTFTGGAEIAGPGPSHEKSRFLRPLLSKIKGKFPKASTTSSLPNIDEQFVQPRHALDIDVAPNGATAPKTFVIQTTAGGFPTRSPQDFAGMMDWLALGHARLPKKLETLTITKHGRRSAQKVWPLAERQSVAEHLFRRYATLRIVELVDTRWRREGASIILDISQAYK